MKARPIVKRKNLQIEFFFKNDIYNVWAVYKGQAYYCYQNDISPSWLPWGNTNSINDSLKREWTKVDFPTLKNLFPNVKNDIFGHFKLIPK